LSEILLKAVRQGGGRACASPIDVVLSDHTILQPDLIYVSKSRRGIVKRRVEGAPGIVKRRVEGAPDLVIEILSESNSRRDRVDKLNLYAEHGVAEYWIVDPDERQFDFLINREGRFEIQPQRDDCYQSPLLPEVRIELADFWAEVESGS